MRDPKAELIACFINQDPELCLFSYTEYDRQESDFSEKPTTLILAKQTTFSMPSDKFEEALHSMFDEEYGPDFVREFDENTTRWSDIRICAMFYDQKRGGNWPKYLLDDRGQLYETIDDCFPFRTIEAQGVIEPYQSPASEG